MKSPLELALHVSPPRLGNAVLSLTLRATFRNNAAEPVRLYPDAAQLSGVSGWLSPSWDVVLEGPSAPLQATELREYDGIKSETVRAERGVLVLAASCPALTTRMTARKDFLRGFTSLFVAEAGRYALRVKYTQEPWDGFFTPRSTVRVNASAALTVE